MNNKLHAIEELKKVQLEYKHILIKINDSPDFSHKALEALDVFWLKNKKLIVLYLEYIIEPYETFVFTGAFNIDMLEKEHFSFSSIGKYHIFDDNVLMYMKTINKVKSINEKLIKDSITNTISLIDNSCGSIFVIPMRYIFSNGSSESEKNMVLSIFCQLFKIDISKNGHFDYNHYLSIFKNIEDLENELIPDFNNIFTLGNNDNLNDSLSTRIKKNICIKDNDVADFYFIMFSYISNALSIIGSCVLHKAIPFMRDYNTFVYVNVILSSFQENNTIPNLDIDKIIKYTKTSFLVYKICTINNENSIDFYNYKLLLEEKKFSKNILSKIDNLKVYHMKDIEDIIIEEFNNLGISTKTV